MKYCTLVKTDDVNKLGGNVYTVKEKAEALVVASQKTELELLIKLRTRSCLEIRMQKEDTV